MKMAVRPSHALGTRCRGLIQILLLLQPTPAVLEVPSKDQPYDPSKDSILRRVKGMFGEGSS